MDILQNIPDEDLPLLIDLYRKHHSEARHIFNLLSNCTAWRRKKPDSECIKFFGINNDWLKSGTFILLSQYGSNTIFMFTLEENCESLHKAFTQTKMIDWCKRTIWFTIALKHLQPVLDIVKELKPASYDLLGASFWMIEKEKALKFEPEIPDDVYVKNLDVAHVKLINDYWPHKHQGSEKYLATFIEMDTSYGVFLKSDDSLVCWILICFVGCISNLQTLSEHKRKGYAALLTKLLSRKIAEKDRDPQAIIMEGNVASENMFRKLGFRKYDDTIYVDCHP